MISYPFNSEMTGYDERGLPIFDRAIDASQFREWTKLFYTNGVSAAGTDFLVTADGTDMTVTVAPGSAQPQTGAATSRCNTILSPMTRAKRTSPSDTDGNIATSNAARRENNFFMAQKNKG